MKRLFALLLVAVIFYYWPYTPQTFLIWDDETILSKYRYFNPVNLQNFTELWLQPYNGLYTPVLKSLWALIISVLQTATGYDWGEKNITLPFIFLNILLHAGNTFLLYKVAENVLVFYGKVKPTAFAALFALGFYGFHPLQIENVNWIMGTKELLWIHFALWSLLFHFKDRMLTALVFYFLAILSKPTAIILIPLFAILALQKKESLFLKKNLALLLPASLAGIALVLWTEKMQPSTYLAGIGEKVLGAVDSFGFYATKIVWPFPLSADYGRHYFWLQTQGWTWAQLVFILMAVVSGWVYLKFPSQRKFLILLLAMFFLPLLTTSGIIGLSFQTYSNVADHYASFSLIPCAVALMLAFSHVKKNWQLGVAAIYLLFLPVHAWNYKTAWADNKSLLQQILTVNNRSFMALNNLGLVAVRENQMDKAVSYFEEARRVKPDFSQPLLNLIVVQTKLRNFDYLKSLSAEIDFERLNDHQLYFEYAGYLQASGQKAEAETFYLKAIELRPGEALYYYRIAAVYLSLQNIEKAKINFQKAAELAPDNKTYRTMNEQIQKL